MKIHTLFPLALLLSPQFVQAEATLNHLKAGQLCPPTEVRTEAGEVVQLGDVIAGKPSVLIFYRGGWCPFCTRHLAAVAEAEAGLRAAGFQLLAISPDLPEKLRARPSHEQLPYTLLSDSEMNAARAFGIAFQVEDALVVKYKDDYKIDLEGDSGQTHHLLPHPAVFIVDAAGVIRFAHVNPDYKVRMTSEEILAAARAALASGQ